MFSRRASQKAQTLRWMSYDSLAVSREQEFVATLGKVLLKLDSRRLIAWSNKSVSALSCKWWGQDFMLTALIHELNLPCVSSSQWYWWWCYGVGNIFFNVCTPPVKYHLNTTICIHIVAKHAHPFTATIIMAACRMMHHITKQKWSQTGSINMTMSLMHFKALLNYQL